MAVGIGLAPGGVLGRVLWHAAYRGDQGDGGRDHGPWLRDRAGITGLLIDLGVKLDTQYIFVAVYFLFTTAAMWAGITLYRGTVPTYRDFRKYT